MKDIMFIIYIMFVNQRAARILETIRSSNIKEWVQKLVDAQFWPVIAQLGLKKYKLLVNVTSPLNQGKMN